MVERAVITAVSPVVEQLTGMRAAIVDMVAAATDQAEAIDRIQELERLKSACAAAQARETAALQRLRLADEAARGVPKARRGRGLGAEIGLARGESATRGQRHLNLAAALTTVLPNTFQALLTGRVAEEHAQVVATETAWLSAGHRREADALIAERLGTVGPRQLAGAVRAHAQRLDQTGALKQLAKAVGQRRVTVRPAPDNMAYLTALLPMQQAVGVYACLRRDATTMVGTGETADPADPSAQPRTRDQIMADLVVERTTGQTSAAAVPAEVQLVMTDGALFGASQTPAWLAGHGPIPAAVVKHWLADPELQVFLRRVFTRPEDHQLVALEARGRSFPPGLRRKILVRDDICRNLWCDNPAEHADHLKPHKKGGSTSYDNGSGLCASCNQTKENTGWRHTGDPTHLRVETPTGHIYRAPTPPLVAGQPPPTHQPQNQPQQRTSDPEASDSDASEPP